MKQIYHVDEIKDPYFGRMISRKGKEIAEVFSCYAKETGWVEFQFRDWFGTIDTIKCRISQVLMSNDEFYVEAESDTRIPEHYFPSLSRLIGGKYGCSASLNFIPDVFDKVYYDAD